MPYYRRAAKRPRYGKRDKYSIQQKAAVAAVAANQTSGVDIVPATVTEGMRKVKHLTVNLTQIATTNAESNLFWALVYVPQGTTAGALNIATSGATPGSMYEPNQFVMNCGVVDPSAGPIRMSSPISRNLNDGDKITLLIRPTRWGGYHCLSCCSLCNHPQLNHNSDGWMDGRWVILNSHRLPSTDVIAIIYITLTLTLLLPTLGRYLRWARSAAPFRLNAPFG